MLGAIIAAGFLWLIKARIVYRADKIAAARVWVPILVGLMAGTFATYLIMKGLKQLVDVSIEVALAIGLAFGLASWLTLIPAHSPPVAGARKPQQIAESPVQHSAGCFGGVA
ncbi:hypothetical protein Q644_05235 [Brucella intermedia 229E]|uniref:Uncharacterized protein n=1 Tax=Brucella intermedia 229E TaxID=1337887 RepID=U4V6X7_9HYPH|nr:hypothetical protein Q644_05235 [Brucella intermedia 229E]